MINLILLAITALVALFLPPAAALIWCMSIALIHAIEEIRGKLWVYFGHTTGATWLTKLGPITGSVLIVVPALVLQWLAAANAFSGGQVAAFWLAMLLGARIGDGLFSHFIPFAKGHAAIQSGEEPMQLNPGLGSAAIYIVDSLLMAIVWHPELGAEPTLLISGFVLGAGFFALVQPALRWTSRLWFFN